MLSAWCAFFLLCATVWARHRFSRRMHPVPAELLCGTRWLVVALTLHSPFFYATLVLAVLFSLREPRERLRLECLFLPVYLVAHLGEWAAVALAAASALGLRVLLAHLATRPLGWSAPFERRPVLRSCCRIATGTLALGLPLLAHGIPPWVYTLALFTFGVGGSPWRRRGELVIVEGTPREAAAVLSLLGPRSRERLRDHLTAAQKQILLAAQPDYLTAVEQASLRRRFLAMGPVLSCATVLDDCPIPDLARWLRCWPEEITLSYSAMLRSETREAVAREHKAPAPPLPEPAEAMGLSSRARRKIYPCEECDEAFVDPESYNRHKNARCLLKSPAREAAIEAMVIRYADAPHLSLDEMVELWPRWFASKLADRCLRGVRAPAPKPQRRPLPKQVPWVAAAGLGIAVGLCLPQRVPSRLDVVEAFGGRVVEGPLSTVAMVPPGVDPEPVRWLAGGNVEVFPLAPAPTLPWWPLPVALLGAGLAYRSRPQRQAAPPPANDNCCGRRVTRIATPEPINVLLAVDPLRFEVGRGLLALVDPNQGAPVLESVTQLRRRAAEQLGVVVPGIRFRDNLKLQPNEYTLSLRDVEIGRGTVMVNHWLALGGTLQLDGLAGTDHSTGESGYWVHGNQAHEVREAGARLLSVADVIARHMDALIWSHAAELLTIQEVDSLLTTTAIHHPAVVSLAREALPLHDLAAFLRNFLRLRGTVRDLPVILEVMCRERSWEKDPALLAERCAAYYKGAS